MRIVLAALVLLLSAGAVSQTSNPATSKKETKAAAPQHSSSQAPAAVDTAELDALKADLQRMNATLNQMRSNLGYVASTTQPLRHQFELEIDLWQMQLGQLERRIQRLEAQSKR